MQMKYNSLKFIGYYFTISVQSIFLIKLYLKFLAPVRSESVVITPRVVTRSAVGKCFQVVHWIVVLDTLRFVNQLIYSNVYCTQKEWDVKNIWNPWTLKNVWIYYSDWKMKMLHSSPPKKRISKNFWKGFKDL